MYDTKKYDVWCYLLGGDIERSFETIEALGEEGAIHIFIEDFDAYYNELAIAREELSVVVYVRKHNVCMSETTAYFYSKEWKKYEVNGSMIPYYDVAEI